MYIYSHTPATRIGRLRRAVLRGVALAVVAGWSSGAQAASLYAEDGVDVRWDNLLRYSTMFRLASPDTTLLSYPNSDDGDRNFAPGLVSSRLDLVSVLDVTTDSFGFQASLEAWYDSVYQAHTDNTSPATYNAVSVPNTRFPHATRTLDGQYADLGDTFVYGNFTIDGMPLSVRVGRQTLLWGESLFFGQNGIAAAQAPVDYLKSTGTPDSYARDVFLPVNQVSLTLQPDSDLSFAAYYQLEGRASRLPGVGSYFSDSDVLSVGAERAFVTQGQSLLHDQNEKPRADGQWGVSLHAMVDAFDLGLYVLRYNSRYPVMKVDLMAAVPAPSGLIGQFHSFYPTGIDVYGASFSTFVGDSTIASEISARQNMPLVSFWPVSPYGLAPLRVLPDKGYAEGDTLHAQISGVTTFSRSPAWDSADLRVELAANDLLGVTENKPALNNSRTHFAVGLRALFEPHYFQILPNLDATPVLGIGYNFVGRSATDYTQNAGTGDFEAGVSLTYRAVWKADLTMTSFVGAPGRQSLTDRDFLMASIERAF